jgi:membrane associated rhomboid family serine protease
MIPIKDEIPTRRIPIVNYVLIAINILVFVYQLLLGPNELNQFVQAFALIPVQVTTGVGVGDVADIFTSMFMHAGWAHIGGNMLYLWIFGDNVEDAMGRGTYIVFYLTGGILASLAHIATNVSSPIPTVGASGAIAAVLGAYMVLYPQSRVMTLLILGYFIRMTAVPAVILLGFWLILQFFQGVLSFGATVGVAFWAHIGGFVAGYAIAWLFFRNRRDYGVRRWE